MAATEYKQMWPLLDQNVAPQVVEGMIESGEGVLMPGAPLYLSQAGVYKLCGTSGGSDKWSGFLVGIKDPTSAWPMTAQLADNTKIWVARIDPRVLYAVFCETGSADTIPAQTNVGDQYGLTVSATATQIGYTTMALDNGNATVEVEDLYVNRVTVKTAVMQYVAIVRFLPAVIDASKA